MITEILGVVVAIIAVLSPFIANKYRVVKRKAEEFAVVLKEVKDLVDVIPDDVVKFDQALMEKLVKEGKDVKDSVALLLAK